MFTTKSNFLLRVVFLVDPKFRLLPSVVPPLLVRRNKKIFTFLKAREEQRQKIQKVFRNALPSLLRGLSFLDSCHMAVTSGQERLRNMCFLCAKKEEVNKYLSGSDTAHQLAIYINYRCFVALDTRKKQYSK